MLSQTSQVGVSDWPPLAVLQLLSPMGQGAPPSVTLMQDLDLGDLSQSSGGAKDLVNSLDGELRDSGDSKKLVRAMFLKVLSALCQPRLS